MSTSPLRTLHADNPSAMTLDGTRTFVVGRERPVVIDPGPADFGHLRAIEQALDGTAPVAILLTHAHPDHAAGATPLARRTGGPVCIAYGALHDGDEGLEVDRWLAEGDVVETDAGTLRAVATPGHAPEHLAFFWTGGEAPDGGALFVGDLLMGVGDTTLVAPPEGELVAYLQSLDRVDQLTPAILYPTHGPPLANPAAAVARYRAHRLERIEQVRQILRARPAPGLEHLVTAVYGPTLDPALRGAAAGSLRAIVEYLEREARIDPSRADLYTAQE